MGAGLGRKLASVHWGVVGQMASAWVFTIPAAALLGGIAWEISDLFGANSSAGVLLIACLAALAAYGLWTLAQRNNVTPEELDRTNVPPEVEAEILERSPAAAVA